MLCVSVFGNLTGNNKQRERLKEREREHYKSSLNIDKNYCTIRLSFFFSKQHRKKRDAFFVRDLARFPQ